MLTLSVPSQPGDDNLSVLSGAESVRLTLVPRKKPKKKLKWADDTVDNEHLGRKKSKSECEVHPPPPGETCLPSSHDEAPSRLLLLSAPNSRAFSLSSLFFSPTATASARVLHLSQEEAVR